MLRRMLQEEGDKKGIKKISERKCFLTNITTMIKSRRVRWEDKKTWIGRRKMLT